MNSENTGLYNFLFRVKGPAYEYVKLKLFNGFDEKIAENYAQIDVQVPRGLYKLSIEFNETVEQRNYRIDRDITDFYSVLGTYSSIPDQRMLSSHEYYSYTAKKYSTEHTVSESNTLTNSSLFLFFRYPNKEIKEKTAASLSMGRYFKLLDCNRKEIFRLNKDNIKEDYQTGWLAFNAPLAKGQYFLIYDSPKNKREIPIYLYDNWQTQLFVTFNKRPLFKTIRILLSRPYQGYQVEKTDNLELDALIQKMYNGIYYVPESLINRAANEKWENPMLGLLVCYAYLLSSDRKYDDLFNIIVDNLQNKILKNTDSPDIRALQLIAATHNKGNKVSTTLLETPCMLLPGMQQFMKQNRIKVGSLAEKVVETLKYDSIWTSYEPVKTQPDNKENDRVRHGLHKKRVRTTSEGFRGATKIARTKSVTPSSHVNWVTNTILTQLVSSPGKVLRIKEMAGQLNLTSSIIKQHLSLIKSSPEIIEKMAKEQTGFTINEAANSRKKIEVKIEKLIKRK